ncbi:protein TESPA1 isoform X1, partial [Clarias magur]
LLAMDSPCSVNRRQAWAQCSRNWLTVEDSELHASASNNLHTTPGAQLSLQDEVFPEGCSTGKIETWLQSCGNDSSQETPSQHVLDSLLKTANSFEDDLSLGAEATGAEFGLQDEEFGPCPLLLPPPKSRRKDLHTSSTPQQKLNLPFRNMGHSMASSIFSSTTNKTASSVSEVLQLCAEDAEETLYHLGFGCEEPQVTARIPARFFTFPSQLRGINFRLFLESQLRRIREEDPSLSLASRFRQVEVLTAMANAFYSLYSHVSRTPLQKLGPPEFSFSSPTVERGIGQRFFGSIRTEPRSPVERLKDTVSKMCLYTRGSDSTSPHYSPRKRNSLPDVAEMMMGSVRGGESHVQNKGMWIQGPPATHNVSDEKAIQNADVKVAEKMSNHDKTTSAHRQRIQRWSQSGQRDGVRAKASLFKSNHASLESRHNRNSWDTDSDEGSSNFFLHSDSSKDPSDTNAPAPIITYDTVSPYLVEHVHKAPYRCVETHSTSVMGLSTSSHMHSPDSCARTLEYKPVITAKSSPAWNKDGLLVQTPVASTISEGDPVSLHSSIKNEAPCRIMVTGWEDEDAVLHSDPFEDNIYFMYPGSAVQMQSDQQRYLSPSNPSSGHINPQLKQANSFELEEVQSVGEEENTSVEQCSAYTLSVMTSTDQK